MAYEKITVSDVTSVTPYEWDGNTRPQIDNYIAPWSDYASRFEYKSAGSSKKKEHNSAIAYAKNRMQAAMKQYQEDLAFWNERDERNYTSQLSQVQRYEDAGFNLGYLYGNVDSGNSAVGYDQGDASFTPSEVAGDETRGLDLAVDIVSTALSVVSGLTKVGVDLVKLPLEKALLQWQKSDLFQSGLAKSLANQWTNFLRSTTIEGAHTDDMSKSLAFAFEALPLRNTDLNNQQLTEFVKYCGKIYENQATDLTKSLIQDIDKMISDVQSPAVSAILKLLALMAIGYTK